MKYMLDTNICIYAIKQRPEQVFIRLQEHDPKEICISSVTYAELVHGVEKSQAIEKNRLALALLLANIEIVSFDSLAAESYGKIRADLEKAGTPIGPLDMMIAGHARSLGYTIVTNNTKEFQRVRDLKLENWVEYPSSVAALRTTDLESSILIPVVYNKIIRKDRPAFPPDGLQDLKWIFSILQFPSKNKVQSPILNVGF